jgi:hypothetical protein
MNRSFLLTIAATALLTLSGAAPADDDDSYRRHSGHGSYGYDRSHYSNRPHGRRDGYGRHDGYRNRGRHGYHHYDHGRDDLRKGLKIVAGAVILGSIIYAINNQNRQASYGAPSYGYRTDSEGRCIQVTRDSSGREVWTHVDPGYCY